MGVVHKLNEEVVSFIITQKQENPQVSCRSLVSIVNERFQIKVSKSSVNAILKDAQLSSAIGRRPLGERPPRKFKIPPQKKSELFSDKTRVDIQSPPANETTPRREPALKKKEMLLKEPTVTYPPQKTISVDKKLESPKDEPAGTKVFSKEKILSKGILYDGMGCFFLKAAQRELSSSSIAGNFLNKYLGNKILTDLNTVGDVLLFSRAFGIRKWNEIQQYQNQGLWALNGLNDKIDHRILSAAMDEVSNLETLSLKIENENILLLTEINHIKIGLEDRTEVYLDAQLNSLWDKNVQSGLSSPLDKCLQILSLLIVNNVHPLIIRGIPGRTEFSAAFYNLLSTFENLESKRIKNVSVCDKNNEEIAQFSIIPNKKRSFIIGAWPWQREFAQYNSEDTQDIKNLYLGQFDQEIYFSESRTKFFHEHLGGKQSPLRVIMLREFKKDSPEVAVVTNILEEQMSSTEIVSAYFLRWPNLQKGYLDFIARTESSLTQQLKPAGEIEKHFLTSPETDFLAPKTDPQGFWFYTEKLLADLHEYCLRHYFPPGFDGQEFLIARERIYSLPGYLKKVQNALVVTLVVPDGYLYKKDLEYAIRRVRESDILNDQGGKLILEMDHSKRMVV